MTNPPPDPSPSRLDVCAVVVTYHPDDALDARVRRVMPQVRALVLVDNGSRDAPVAQLRRIAADPAVTLIENRANLGIARALNQGVDHARTLGCTAALLLDQDTAVDADLVEVLAATRASLPDADRVALIGSCFRDTHGRPAESRPLGAAGAEWREVESLITSGSLLSLTAYAAIGPFRDEFFIDYVDTEYCFRARALGYRIIEARRALMAHTVGAPTHHRMLGREKWTTNHSAERRYYIARNNTVMLREYGTARGGSWRWKSVVRCMRLCKRILLFENDKLAKLRAVRQGWWDALHGVMGPRHQRRQTGARAITRTP